jgi:hypothetical protein
VNAEDFIESIHTSVYHPVIDGVLRQLARPVGARPRAELVNLSEWFNQLTPPDAERVAEVVRIAAYQAIFDLMAVLDGVQIVDDDHSRFRLETESGMVLNERHDLHELLQIRVDHELGYVDESGRPLDSP